MYGKLSVYIRNLTNQPFMVATMRNLASQIDRFMDILAGYKSAFAVHVSITGMSVNVMTGADPSKGVDVVGQYCEAFCSGFCESETWDVVAILLYIGTTGMLYVLGTSFSYPAFDSREKCVDSSEAWELIA